MPTVRYQIRNEYGLADPEVYRAAEKDDPEALLEGVAMAGLVGVLRQLGDLAEFAADVFHDLHEEVMSTSSRGHGLILRFQQLEAEFPVIEKAMLSQIDHSHGAYNSGIDWHPNLRVEQNLVIQGDMPRFVLDSYEECRGPPQLFMLDKFDVAGAGACLTRYSNPSFFKIESASSEIMESELQREKNPRKIKQKGSCWSNDEIPYSFSTPIMDYLQFPACEPVPDKLPARLIKLKHRNLKVSDVSNRKSYMEGLINEVLEKNDPEFTLSGSNINKSIDWLEEREVLTGGMTNSSLFREDVLPQSPKELNAELPSPERKGKNFFDTTFTLSGVSEKLHPPSQNAKEEEMLMGHGNEVKNVDFDAIFDGNDMNLPSLQLAECNNLLLDSGFITDEDHDGYRSDDVGSELENYVDALNTMETEVETDSESRGISDPNFFNRQPTEINPKINGHLELQPQSCGPGSIGRFATLLDSEKVNDVVPSLLKSTNLVDLNYQQLQLRTIVEETSSLEIKTNQGETGQVERAGECIELLPSVCSISNGTCYQKQPNDTMLAPISRDAISSSCIKDSVLKPNGKFKEAQSLSAYSEEEISGRTRSTPEVNKRAKFSFLPWKTNTAVVPPTFKEGPDVHEDDNILGHSEDIISTTITGNDHMSCNSSKTEYIILLEKAPDESSIISPLIPMGDAIGKPLQIQETEKNDFISGSRLSSTPIGSIVLESYDMSIDLETNMQSEYSAMKITSKYMGGHDEERKQLKSSMVFPDETHELYLLVSDDGGSHESTQTSENVDDDVAYISDERGSHHGRGKSSMTSLFSGYTEKTMSNDTANTFQMLESSQKSSLAEVSTVYGKDSFHDSKDNEIYSVKNLSPEISDSALEIVSFNLRLESLAGEIGNVSVATDVVHPQSPASSGDVDICRCDLSTSPVISYELEQLPIAKEPHDSANVGILEPLLLGSGEIPDISQLHPELVDLIETNEVDHVNGELEVTNGSSKVDLHREILVGKSEKDYKALDDNAIAEDGTESQVLNMLESAKVTTSKLCSMADPLPEDDVLYRVRPDDEELAITSDSTFLLSENKSHFLFTQIKEQEMFIGSLSSQISVLDLSNSFDTKLINVNVNDPHVKLYHNFKGDNIFSNENKQDADSISENVITEDDTDAKVLSMLQSSNLCRSDVQFQENSFSEEATLNQYMPEIENLGISSQDSICKTCIAEDGTDGQILSLLESSYAHIQEDLVSEEASLNQHRQEIEEPALTGDLTSLKFGRDFCVPFSKNGDQEPVSVVSSSQSPALYSSNFGDATLSDHNFDDILMEFYPGLHEESLICSKEGEQDSERPEFQSEQAFVSEPSTIPINEMDENMEPSNIHLDEDCSDGNTIIQYSLEPEILVTEPDPLAFLNHECNNRLNMSPSKAYVSERIKNDLSILFQDVSEHPGNSIASEVLASKSLAADFISPVSITNTQEPRQAVPCKTFSRLSLQGVEETPPLPPLPPIQWRIGKPPQGSLISDGNVAKPVVETNPFMFPLNSHMVQQAGPFMLPTSFIENFHHVSPCIGTQITESSNVSMLPQIDLDQKQHFEIQFPEIETVNSSGLSLIISSKEDGNHAHDNAAMEGADPFTLEERRPKLVNLLPGLELERSQEAPIIDTDAIAPSNSFMFMPTTGAGMHQYDYGDYGGYEGENLQNHSLSASFPVTVHGFPHYGYHMFLTEGDSSTIYDMALPEMDGDNPNWKHRFVRNKQRDPLIEAVAAHDKSTLRKVSELDPPLKTSKEDETNYLLEQIKNKSFNLKPATSGKANMLNAPSTNLKVAAILQKANAIRQACAGSDEEDDDNWS